IGVTAMHLVSPETIEKAVPEGWLSPFFGHGVGHDWTGILDNANKMIETDGNQLFLLVFGLMMLKGVLASLAGPAPNYDIHRVLATRSPREACLMNGIVNVVLYFPRYMMIAGITVLALAYSMPQVRQMQEKGDYEALLPIVLSRHVPTG